MENRGRAGWVAEKGMYVHLVKLKNRRTELLLDVTDAALRVRMDSMKVGC
jgi:hypothetical protein